MFERSKKRRPFVSIDDYQLALIAEEMGDRNKDDRIERVYDCLKLLSKEEMQLIELRIFEALSFKEMGIVLGITDNSAKTKMYRVFEKMKILILNKKK
jgi:RNA polymerase sigma-70 factor (ECF subfamily)